MLFFNFFLISLIYLSFYLYPICCFNSFIISCLSLVPSLLKFSFYVCIFICYLYCLNLSSLNPLAFKMLLLCLLLSSLLSLFLVLACLSCTSLFFKFSFYAYFRQVPYPYFLIVSCLSRTPSLWKFTLYIHVYLVCCPYSLIFFLYFS